MAWSIYTHASIGDTRNPRPLGTCDRCGMIYNRDVLRWQYDWAGLKEFNKGVLVCRKCMDVPQQQLKNIKIPIDPVAIVNPRPGEFTGMAISSSPNVFDTVVPSQIVVQSSATDGTQEIGDRSPIVTQDSSEPLLTEVTVVPYPDPNMTYTRQGDASS